MKKNGPEPFFLGAAVDDGVGAADFAAGVGVDDGVTTPRVGTSGIVIDAALAPRAALFLIAFLAVFLAGRLATAFFTERLEARDVAFLATDFFAAFLAIFLAGAFLAAFFTAFFGLRVAATEMTPRYDPCDRVI